MTIMYRYCNWTKNLLDTVALITNQEEVVLPRSLLSAGRVIRAHGGGQTPAQQTTNVEQAAGAV
jgi:hypothetical protein